MSLHWTANEVAATVVAYLRMLTLELTGQTYNKSEQRRALRQLLPDRFEGALEFKHGNISAVMGELGYPYIRGNSRGRTSNARRCSKRSLAR